VVAGLEFDMEWTSGTIYSAGKIVADSYVYLNSTWATPIIVMDGDEWSCWIYESEAHERWGDANLSNMLWPQSARDILDAPRRLTAGE